MKETTAIVIIVVAFLAFSFGYFYFKPEEPVKEVSVEIDWSEAEIGDMYITVPGCRLRFNNSLIILRRARIT
jgi:hypothetical protein